jgi:6-phosphogluconate dehydrogenase
VKAQADIGLIGLAVMGQNLVLNMADHGFTVAVFNRTVAKVDAFINREAAGSSVIGTHSVAELVGTSC